VRTPFSCQEYFWTFFNCAHLAHTRYAHPSPVRMYSRFPNSPIRTRRNFSQSAVIPTGVACLFLSRAPLSATGHGVEGPWHDFRSATAQWDIAVTHDRISRRFGICRPPFTLPRNNRCHRLAHLSTSADPDSLLSARGKFRTGLSESSTRQHFRPHSRGELGAPRAGEKLLPPLYLRSVPRATTFFLSRQFNRSTSFLSVLSVPSVVTFLPSSSRVSGL
jgi:hypothetical protein